MSQFAQQTSFVAEHELNEMESPALVAFIEENKLENWDGFPEFVEMINYRENAPYTFLGHPVTLESYWGGGGDGAEFYYVVKCNERYFQFMGYYSSWDSSQWVETATEVVPEQVVVTRYRELKGS